MSDVTLTCHQDGTVTIGGTVYHTESPDLLTALGRLSAEDRARATRNLLSGGREATGRPRKIVGDSCIIGVRLATWIRDALDQEAQERGMLRSEVLRDILTTRYDSADL